MADDVARAVGAGDADVIMIGDVECKVRPLSIRELGEVERECLSLYKRKYLETFSQNLDLLEHVDGVKLMTDKMEMVAKWDVVDLPHKYVYDQKKIVLNDSLRQWILDNIDIDLTDDNGKDLPEKVQKERILANTAVALDSQNLSDELYENLTGEAPRKTKVNYSSWWITGTFDGMMTMVWLCFKHNGVTKEQVEKALADDPGLMAHVSRSIENLSTPAVGNG